MTTSPPFLRLVEEPTSTDTTLDDFDYASIDSQEQTLEELIAEAARKAAAEADAAAAAAATPASSDTDADAVPLDTIQIRPEDNVSRGGTMDGPAHPRIQLFAASMVSPDCGRLLEGLGLEALAAPVARPCGPFGYAAGQRPCCPVGATGHHTFRLRYGFRRIVALRLAKIDILKRSRGEVVIHTDATRRQLDIMGGIENLFRDEPTHVQLAQYLVYAYTEHKMPMDQIVEATGMRTPTIEAYMRMFTRLPPDLLAVWRVRETPEVERALGRIANIDPDNRAYLRAEDRHAHMRAQWALVEATWAQEAAAKAAAAAMPQAVPKGGYPGGNSRNTGTRKTIRRTLRSLAIEVDRAREIWDAAAGGWRPVTAPERDLLRTVLAHLDAPAQIPLLR